MPPSTASCHAAAAEGAATLHGLLEERAARSPDALAFRFLRDGESDEESLTLGELAARAKSTAAALIDCGATGKPVLLARPPGLGFIEGLFACWHAGAIAVPAYPPRGSRHTKRLRAILADCGAALALTAEGQPALDGVRSVEAAEFPGLVELPEISIGANSPCLLQYTSGSTAAPKGVMISHGNFRSHFAALMPGHDLGYQSIVSWLPPYHDMGLVLKILHAFELGVPLTFFPPEHFIQRPVRWLRAISRYRAEMSGGPNFAFEMCVRSIRDEELAGLDLSCWKTAPCGAERIRPETLEKFARRFAPYGFDSSAFAPGYGLAEATLIATASRAGQFPKIISHPTAGRLVSNGRPLPGVGLRIVDPGTGSPCREGDAGEIRLKGPTISSGYWNRPDETAASFSTSGELRTGDLGFLKDGELYVTGRIKDLIIIGGTNFAPDDIEAAVLSAVPEVTGAAAFSTSGGGRESVTMILEAPKVLTERLAALCDQARRAIGEALEIPVSRVVTVRTGLLPRTTSGKVQRAASRAALEDGSLKPAFDDAVACGNSTADSHAQAAVLAIISEITGRQGAGADDDLISFGLSSVDVTRLAAMLRQRAGITVSIGELFAARSIADIATRLSDSRSASAFPENHPSVNDASVMSHSQERMWFLHQLDPESASYHVFGALELRGELDACAMVRAIQQVIARHEILRSRHAIEDGQPRVWIEANQPLPVAVGADSSEEALRSELTRFARLPFKLASDSPIRVCLRSCGSDFHVLAICAHHIVIDGWSLRVLGKEIATAYAARHSGGNPAAPSYLAYASAHRRWVDGGAVDVQIDYWKSQLAGHPGMLQLATDFPRPASPSSDGASVEVNLSANLCNRVAALAKAHRATPFMVHLAVFLLLLRRHGAGDDPVVAIPVANRQHAPEDLVGTLVNTLPFRLTLDPGETFGGLLDRIRAATFDMQSAQDAPFERIIEAVKPGRSRDHSPLAQVMFDYQEIPIAETWAGGVECRPFICHRGAVQFDLSLLLMVLSDRQRVSIEYRSELFTDETAGNLLDRYLETLEEACLDPSQPLSEIRSLTDSDRDFLSSVSEGPVRPGFPHQNALALIAKRVALHPDRVAVDSESGTIDYRTLDARSTRLAAALRSRGVKPGDRVAVLLERDAELPVALLAVWKAGAAYVPLDSANPPERLKLILGDQESAHVLAAPGLTDCLPVETTPILFDGALPANVADFTPFTISPADPAYLIYTSGSTGTPKGVVVSHGALANFLLSMAESPGLTEADRLLAVTTISFDISALEIFLPLITGGTLDLASTAVARDGAALLARLNATKPTVMQATPATWRMLCEAGWRGSPGLKILCGGEALDLPLARQLQPLGRELWNLYGPTETTIWSTLWQVPENPDAVGIGAPIANTGIHILAPDGSELPPGVPGELWISGAGLAEGYWRRPDLTTRAFRTLSSGTRGYATGDLARWRRDGTLECLGRSDSQVKIRGFRVELGEIEAALAAHQAVAHAKVAFRGTDHASQKLLAWVTTNPSTGAPTCEELREFIATRLPVYMLPADIGVIDAFPLNSNGKVDVSRLENPEPPPHPSRPLTDTERKLAAIWSELLERPVVGADDDWFQVGGHSLLALRLFSRIHHDFDRRLPLSAILDHPTLSRLASAIEGASVAGS